MKTRKIRNSILKIIRKIFRVSEPINELVIEEETAIESKVQCAIVFEDKREWGYRHLAHNLIPDTSIPISDDNLIHLLNLSNGKLSVIDFIPADNKDKTPQDCMEATSWEELAGVLGVGIPTVEKIKLGIFVGLCIGELVLLFLLSALAME